MIVNLKDQRSIYLQLWRAKYTKNTFQLIAESKDITKTYGYKVNIYKYLFVIRYISGFKINMLLFSNIIIVRFYININMVTNIELLL